MGLSGPIITNLLRATSQLPRVVRDGQFLTLLTYKCASCHKGVHFFRHLNFSKCSGVGVFLWILTSKCASRHNSGLFFISHLARWLRTRRFSEPTFRPSWATNHWKNKVNRNFPTFSRTCLFLPSFSPLWSSHFFSSPPLLFQLSILWEVSFQNFFRIFTYKIYTHLHIYISTYLHTFISTYLHIYISTYLHIYISTYLHICIFTYLHIYMYPYLHIYISTYLHIYISTYLHIYISTCIHIYISSNLHIYMYTYIHIYIYTYLQVYISTYLHIYISTYLQIYISTYIHI